MSSYEPPLSGEIFDERTSLSLDELSRLCAVDSAYIVELVEEGVLHVTRIDIENWRFSGSALRRARTALRLQRDLEINLPGVALALELLEQIDSLRREFEVRR
jgi:chaperone modulatory protein CbpM